MDKKELAQMRAKELAQMTEKSLAEMRSYYESLRAEEAAIADRAAMRGVRSLAASATRKACQFKDIVVAIDKELARRKGAR